jgi:hypothetical protein
MSVHIIKYYINDKCITQFVGDDETVCNSTFYLKNSGILPDDFTVTKTTSDHREFVLRLFPGGYSWVEVYLNMPSKEKIYE